ncbi:dTDP-4-dehydrorhamnose 3,5-epimerase [Aequorivita echinoideorum]|uniref:dTDP-4-dehydrorhamnose 3,5-epimerase n=1 Tax=Aequorivita echinoideorum TaxID=1549647 RepID=A0ABS5S426_9FLAO|nr:dTDP-4-dehydrorhamnose 3,5-epimerase [Aequorivita echinoideorum]MBT0607948.1 dTDP-4-dehydrorhamnose 3,5-epimerase [Aequorivita echinoideorum]
MEVEKTNIKDCFVIAPTVFQDSRGYFMETFNENTFKKATGLQIRFVQDNESQSNYGVIRGLHAQKGTMAQAKLVRVLKGEVLDVVVDFRPDSQTYLQHYSISLSAENKKQLFVPRGCLHGFSVLSGDAIFFYKCDNFYDRQAEYGYRFDDPAFGIDWQIAPSKRIISEKDMQLPFFESEKK